MERRDRLREDDAVLVVVLLDRGGDDAGDAHSIAAHLERTTVARLVEKRRFHGFRILGAQLKDVADLDPPDDFQSPLAVGAGIAGNDLADVCYLPGLREVTSPVDAREVESRLVCAADEIAHCRYRAIGAEVQR